MVFVYGPPSVGKLTVAQALSRLTGYGVFHNHLTFDIARAFFTPFSDPFLEMLRRLRTEALSCATELGATGVIFTMCYDHPADMAGVRQLRSVVVDRGGDVVFVQLLCSREELLKRVQHPNRRTFHKLTDPHKLEESLDRWDLSTPVEDFPSLTIDNTDTDPEAVAERIADHYHLPRTDQ